MSAQIYEPLQAVPPITENHVKMAWLLQARQAARTALDAALAVPRKAAAYVGRLIHKLHLNSAASWLDFTPEGGQVTLPERQCVVRWSRTRAGSACVGLSAVGVGCSALRSRRSLPPGPWLGSARAGGR